VTILDTATMAAHGLDGVRSDAYVAVRVAGAGEPMAAAYRRALEHRRCWGRSGDGLWDEVQIARKPVEFRVAVMVDGIQAVRDPGRHAGWAAEPPRRERHLTLGGGTVEIKGSLDAPVRPCDPHIMAGEFKYFEKDGAIFRKRTALRLHCIEEVQHGGAWMPYEGDRGAPYAFGDEIQEERALRGMMRLGWADGSP
jgi:hypothetical protein